MDEIQKQIAALNIQWQKTRQGLSDELYSSLSTSSAPPPPAEPKDATPAAAPVYNYTPPQPAPTQYPQEQDRYANQLPTTSYPAPSIPAFPAQTVPSKMSESSSNTFAPVLAPDSFYKPKPMAGIPTMPSHLNSNYLSTVSGDSSASVPSSDIPTKSAAGEQMAKRLEALRSNKNAAPAKKPKTTIDIALLMDLTGSMQLWFDQAKRKVREIVDSVHSKYPDAELRMGFVGYRDFTDDGQSRYEVHNFGTAEQLQIFMEEQVGKCDGGFDAAEDVIGGFAEVLKLNWTARTRLIIFIADAPGHGQEFHDMGPKHDRYLLCDDPSGRKSSDLKTYVRQMCNKNIDLYFFHLMDVTIKMENLFDSLLQKFGCRLFNLKLDQNVDQFLPNVLQSIDSSVMRSNWGN